MPRRCSPLTGRAVSVARLVFVAMFLHIINMGVLWFGTHQMRPKTVHVPVERGANTANMIY